MRSKLMFAKLALEQTDGKQVVVYFCKLYMRWQQGEAVPCLLLLFSVMFEVIGWVYYGETDCWKTEKEGKALKKNPRVWENE